MNQFDKYKIVVHIAERSLHNLGSTAGQLARSFNQDEIDVTMFIDDLYENALVNKVDGLIYINFPVVDF